METSSQCTPSAPNFGGLPTCKLSSAFPLCLPCFHSFHSDSVGTAIMCSLRSPLAKNHYVLEVAAHEDT